MSPTNESGVLNGEKTSEVEEERTDAVEAPQEARAAEEEAAEAEKGLTDFPF